MPFFHFSQNNSGGGFVRNENVDADVIIEADDYVEANDRAEAIGIYFDGEGDCPCCGRRWSPQWTDEDGYDSPSIYGQPIGEIEKAYFRERVLVHYLSGKVGEFKFRKAKK